ncbi:MAG: hypothetical protein [Caudoviricetes sp.]|nr:MAG: hypothetical protein [Caudoviricetes sp.]
MIDMTDRLTAYLKDARLTDGYKVQAMFWRDTGKTTDKFIVIQPAGGTIVAADLSNDYFATVWVLGAQGGEDMTQVIARAREIMQYVKDHQIDSCLGSVNLLNPFPTPVQTEEKRVAIQISLRIRYGE